MTSTTIKRSDFAVWHIQSAVLHFFDEIRSEDGYELDLIAVYDRIQSTPHADMAEVFDSLGLVLSVRFEQVDPVVIAIMMNRLALAYTEANKKLFEQNFFVPLVEVDAVMWGVSMQFETPHLDLLVANDVQETPIYQGFV